MQTSYDDQQIAHTESLWDLGLKKRLAITYPDWNVHVGNDHKVIDIYNPNGSNAGLGLFITNAKSHIFNTRMGNSSQNPISTKRDMLKKSFIRELNKLQLKSGEYSIDSNLINNKGLEPLVQESHYV
jgi:hypothetical protein